MTIAAKHFDPQLGIDIHLYLIPPSPIPIPLPTPHIGIVLDPFDYIPVIGGTVQVNGIKRATAGSMGLDIHIPVGGIWMPTMKMPMGPQWDDEIFMGSKTVLADGEPFSRVAMPVLACNIVGMVAPFRLKKPKKPHLSLLLPTTLNLAIPTNVFVGGPPTVSWTSLLFNAGLAGLGKVLKKTGIAGRAADAFKKVRQKLFKNMEPGFLKCKVLRAEPVDIRDGSVSVEHEDFNIPGRLPLTWTRRYSSVNAHAGLCGHGWQTPADIRLEVEPDGTVLFIDASSTAVFPQLPAGEGIEHAVREFVDGARLFREDEWLWVRTKDGLRHGFVAGPANVAALQPRALPIERIEDLCGNHWRFERRDGQLVRIVESGIDGLQGRYLDVQTRHGLIERLQLHDPASGISHPLVSYRHDGEGDLIAALDALDAARTFEYQQHRLLRHTDRVGLSFYYAYNARWKVIHAWGDGGLHDYRFHYDDLLHETEITDSLGHVSLVKFDDNGLPLCEIDPLDGVTVFEYDDVGRTTAVVDPMGLRTQFEYDERGNVLRLVRADGGADAAEYDDNDRPVRVVDALGAAWCQDWDERGQMTAQRTPLGHELHYRYDACGLLTEHTDACGAQLRLAFDRYGLLAEVTDALDRTIHRRHDVMGCLLEEQHPDGRSTQYRYDAKRRLVEIVRPGAERVNCEYDSEDRLIRHRDESGLVTHLEYCGIGWIARRSQPGQASVRYRYGSEGQLTAVVNQRDETYQFDRDALGRVVRETDFWGQSRHHRYDAASRIVSSSDPLGRVMFFTTDALGRIIEKRTPDDAHPGVQLKERFCYSAAGQLIKFSSPASQVTRRFDAEDRLIEEVQNGFHIKYAYDPMGRRVGRSSDVGNALTFELDARGMPVRIAVDDADAIRIERDAAGLPVRELLGAALVRQRTYLDGHMAALVLHRGQVPVFETSYEYDIKGNLTRRADTGQGTDRFAYDPLGRLIEHTDPEGRLANWFSDPAGDRLQTRVQQAQVRSVMGGDADVVSEWWREGDHGGRRYRFDAAGNLGSRSTPHRSGESPLSLDWDAHQRLTQVRVLGADGVESRTRYGYDALGRRVFKRGARETTWFFWDGDALMAEVTRPNDDAAETTNATSGKVIDLLAARRHADARKNFHAKAREYVYRPGSFEPLFLIEPLDSGDSSAFVRSVPARKALEVTPMPGVAHAISPFSGRDASAGALARLGGPLADAGPASEKPPGLGLGASLGGGWSLAATPSQQEAIDEPVIRQADAIEPVAVVDATPGADEDAEASGHADAPTPPRAIYHFHNDPNGCPRRITDAEGRVVWSTGLSAWGAVAGTTVTEIANPLRFQGQYFDSESGLHYNRYRYYDPTIGQYVSQDPIGLMGGLNVYAYVDNPTGWIDPLGLWGDDPMNGATATITVGNVSKRMASTDGPGHAEINALNWFLDEGGGFDNQHVTISDVVGHFRDSGIKPVGVCTGCRANIFDVLQQGNAASVTIPKSVGNRVVGTITIPAAHFAQLSQTLHGIHAGDGTDPQKSKRAWEALENVAPCIP
ncbi:RHS repeat-associated core domain-containing protein [Montanilutibacter psychrotolerans]|uniref:Type IV secretion protein Rhs n=1 Tax=Montanilutibacter psychrotolerans TaxID=1327343 RepID=A0A3M8SUN4_9GAMM|nr:RHS repeat-associated core domain-containing protein [Lysobacter psychrotolerans]RNF85009.1 type IV secretion protein Rhs [Lysobacter psychrotolerans]